MSTASFAYRQNVVDIWDARIPSKYTRLLPYITGGTILEIGAAEGVLSLLMADRDPSAQIIALERHEGRHKTARELQARWRELGKRVDGCTMVHGDIRERSDLLDGVDTFVAIRTIYHLQESVESVFAAVGASSVSRVVLGGNPNRAKWPHSSPSVEKLGKFNLYAGVKGMSDVLEGAGFRIGTVIAEGDPIVVGTR